MDSSPIGITESASKPTKQAIMRSQTDSKNVFVNRAHDIISKASQEDVLSLMTDERLREDSRPASAVTEKAEATAIKGNKAGIAGGMLVTQHTMQPEQTKSLQGGKPRLQDEKEAPAKF
jgi:hypothetical protein